MLELAGIPLSLGALLGAAKATHAIATSAFGTHRLFLAYFRRSPLLPSRHARSEALAWLRRWVGFCTRAAVARSRFPARPITIGRVMIEYDIFHHLARGGADYGRGLRAAIDAIESGPVLQVETSFDLSTREESIAAYLDALESRGIVPARFLCVINLKHAYVAPLQLVTGLQAHFDADWKPTIRDYEQHLQGLERIPSLRDRKALQRFAFTCWLLWGPSVPICRCRAFHNNNVAYQIGFGDENNSLPLVLSCQKGPHDATPRQEAEFLTLLRGGARLAIPVDLRCALVANSEASLRGHFGHPDILGAAQRVFLDRQEYKFVLPWQDAVHRQESDHPHAHYEAYIWILFVVKEYSGEAEVRPEHDVDELLPIFLHSNIADPYTYEAGKRALARLAVAYLEELLPHAADLKLGRRVRIFYACAVDASECDAEPVVPDAVVLAGKPIRDHLRDEWRARGNPELDGALDLDFMPDNSLFAACHVPEMIADYVQLMKGQKATVPRRIPPIAWQLADRKARA